MTLKMIAIGILALLGLSSVMKPKAFRLFLGGVGAVCMALYLGFVFRTDGKSVANPVVARVQTFLGHEPDWRESAEAMSQQLLDDIQAGKKESSISGDQQAPLPLPTRESAEADGNSGAPKATTPNPSAAVRKLIPIQIRSESAEQQKVDAVAELQRRIDGFLDLHRKGNPNDPGVELLSHSDIDPRMLRFIGLKQQQGLKLFYWVVDDRFVNHVRAQGRKRIIRQRMNVTTIAASAGLAALFFAYGLLKVVNGREQRRIEDDFLTNSNVSMV